ncbi:NADH-quinone oxidoreductase subunit M [Vulcanibacillus modesticaldus]|uniref:NADH-quinone oxidoreductase subunit M n=1 Tax=Vulcanibacillus modesticaldus TaxID=337097 RepID=A0A1D2YVS7_9BACI|nr:NADH-quinone oxidoreductase subunit M [Vulcanibacillus modesticaldus]OEF99819.1 NADH-quinone oxidoreductase subunit M [Vulcanibacillus modesticaldus]
MMDSIGLLTLITFSPLLGVLLLAFVPSNKAGTIKLIGVLVSFIPLILSFVMFSSFDSTINGMQFVEDFDWIQIPLADNAMIEFKYSLGVDGLSMPLVVLSAIVASMSAIAAVNMIKKRWKEYFILFFLMQVGLYGVFAAQNLFLFFIFFEITLITMFFLVGIWGLDKREDAAFTFLLYNGLGSAILLISFVVLLMSAGYYEGANGTTIFTTDIQTIIFNLNNSASPYELLGVGVSDAIKYGVFFALLVAFGIKVPLFPFHSWILKVHYQAPPPMSMILSGVLLKIGAYGLFRMNYGFFPEITETFSTLLIILGIINLFYGGILAFVQEDMKMVVVYSSISHVGIIILGLGAMNSFGFQGAVFQIVSHGLLASLFFYIVGVMYNRVHTTKFSELGGMAKTMPFTSGILLTGALASLGLPGMSGFISEFLTFLGLFENRPILAAISTLGVVLTTVYLLRSVLNVTYGPTAEKLTHVSDARSVEMIPMVVLVGFVILVGVYPAILSEPIQATLQLFLTRIGG